MAILNKDEGQKAAPCFTEYLIYGRPCGRVDGWEVLRDGSAGTLG